MYLRNIHCYWRLAYRQCIKFNNAITSYSHIPYEKHNYSSLAIKSMRFPDYELLYVFPYITFPRILSILKRNQTIIGGASIPIIMELQQRGLIPEDEYLIIISACVAFTGWLHLVGYMCNNFIGSICFKPNTEEIIISYINYWGTRVDLKTTVTDIIPVTETTGVVAKYWPYKTLNIKSCKRKLKINTQFGEFTNGQELRQIFGCIE